MATAGSAEKDFGAIAEDYAFFERQATEAVEDARAYAQRLKVVLPAPGGPIRMLDFGCGSGTFTERLLKLTEWAPEHVRLTLVEPSEEVRRKGRDRLLRFTTSPVVDRAEVAPDWRGRFDLVLANHSLYYVNDLKDTVRRLLATLDQRGVMMAAMAGRANPLIALWQEAFASIGREIPYHVAEDVAAVLERLGVAFEKEAVAYELVFPDSEENRMRIVRFLLAEHLGQMDRQPLVAWFDRYREGDAIAIRTACDHFIVPGRGKGDDATAEKYSLMICRFRRMSVD